MILNFLPYNKINLNIIYDRFIYIKILNTLHIINIYIADYTHIYIHFNYIIFLNLNKLLKFYGIYYNFIKKNIKHNKYKLSKNIFLNLKGTEYKIIEKNNYILLYLGYSYIFILNLKKIQYNIKNNLLNLNNIYFLNYSYVHNISSQIYILKILNKYKHKGFTYEI